MENFWIKINIFNSSFYKKPLSIHVFWAVLLLLLLLLGTSLWLNIFTRHNSYTKVPTVVGLKTEIAIAELEKSELNYLIADSIYTDKQNPNTVITQIPDPNASVKTHRTVYLIINRAHVPSLAFPNIEGVSYSTACEIIKAKGFTINDTIYRDDDAKDVVIDHLYNNRSVHAGENLPLSAGITIVLGNGKTPSYEYEWVPNLVGIKLSVATAIAEKLKLKLEIKSEMPMNDEDATRILRQVPTATNEDGDKNKLLQSSTIVVWLTE